jgi:peroxiredoxin
MHGQGADTRIRSGKKVVVIAVPGAFTPTLVELQHASLRSC